MYNKAEKQQNFFNLSHRVHITTLVIYAPEVDTHKQTYR